MSSTTKLALTILAGIIGGLMGFAAGFYLFGTLEVGLFRSTFNNVVGLRGGLVTGGLGAMLGGWLIGHFIDQE